MEERIVLKRVRVHNLKHVSLSLPLHELIVFTGVSGSGKSSLAFDTIYVEGQRRYIESLSTYARRRLGEMSKPEADEISGISPTVAIEQKTSGRNPRSTVGTLTGIYDHLRVLYARIATPHCPVSGQPVAPQSLQSMIHQIMHMPLGSKLLFLSNFVKGKRGEFKEEFQHLTRRGYIRLRLDGKLVDLTEEIAVDGKVSHTIDLVIDRIVLSPEEKLRVTEAVTLALKEGKGVMSVFNLDTQEETLYSETAFSSQSGLSYGPLEPQDFSFNHPSGMCPTCFGLGEVEIEEKHVLCSACTGARIKPYPAAALLKGKTIFSLAALSLKEALDFFERLSLSKQERIIAEELVKEITLRLRYLIHVGLHYLTLNRTAPTLSGGESQRVRLASQIGAGLVGATYILDEPSIGLHPRDNLKLLHTLRQLCNQGNTVIVVEHDEETIKEADYFVDVGPLAGKKGGEIVAQGTLKELLQSKRSLTAAYLTGRQKIAIPSKRRMPTKAHTLTIEQAEHHNLKKLTASFPLKVFVAVTGVSGSGKSSLITDILAPALSNVLHKARLPVGKHRAIKGIEHLDKVISIDQTPIGRTPRSNPATYIKLFDDIRALFSQLPESGAHGFLPGQFSFNSKEGSCPYCKGMGMEQIDMDFMEEQWTPCLYCEGKRFDQKTLSVQYRGKNIHDVLEMDVEEALDFFSAHPKIKEKLSLLMRVGLDYIRIGQPSPTLSGGEAQRIKLAKELSRPSHGKTLYILDEPTTGLHFYDIEKLVGVLQDLVNLGNTVLVIEHNMDLVKTADWVIDLGPEGGHEGGQLIGEGTPEHIASLSTPTGLALKNALHPVPLKASRKKVTNPALETLRVEDAYQNNLKHVSASLPHGKITLCTGPSGSGKSSFAFETIYAEGQRRYTETLSPYARQFVKQMPKPKVEKIEGLRAAIAIEQKKHAGNPRSTVGTMTEIYDYLRILYAHLGIAHCPETGEKIESISKEFVLEKLLSLPSGTRLHVLAPIILHKHESFEQLKDRLQRQGFLRIRLNKEYWELDQDIPFDSKRKNTLFLVVDRLVVRQEDKKRLYEAIDQAASLSKGTLVVASQDEDFYFNLSFAVLSTGKSYPPITPHTFSFNTEEGMCLDCQGIGSQYGVDLTREKEALSRSPLELILILWKDRGNKRAISLFSALLKKEGIDPYSPLSMLSVEDLNTFLNGSKKEWALEKNAPRLRWIGLNRALAKVAKAASGELRYSLISMVEAFVCPACQGTRLKPLARHVRIDPYNIAELCHLSIEEMLRFVSHIDLASQEKQFLEPTVEQLKQRLHFLKEIGLAYLSLDRSAPTLSGGETQRIHLARQLGSGLTGCLYVLDEPTIGLHPHNNELLNRCLRTLRDMGNTLLLVEHDPMTVSLADLILDFGPGAGSQGGMITAQGTFEEIKSNPSSLTGAYLSGRKKIPLPQERRKSSVFLSVQGASLHNLKNLTVDFPVQTFTCLTGVSGSGKSTLMNDLLRPALSHALQARHREPDLSYLGAHITGLNHFDKLLVLDQNPVGYTLRADVSTYVDLHSALRTFYASLPLAKSKGLTPGHFSSNHRRGMCPTCRGMGLRTVYLQFLPPVKVTCESCHGYRLKPLSLEVTYKGKHLGDVMDMTVDAVREWLVPIPKAIRILDTLISVGLGYLKLGQEIASLSGGEAQRLRLSRELAKRSTGKTLYLLDEPTIGLHAEDIRKLLPIFHTLVDKGNTVIIIEHNLDVIANADHVIDLGPDAGEKGGEIITCGTPEEVASHPTSFTAHYLRNHL